MAKKMTDKEKKAAQEKYIADLISKYTPRVGPARPFAEGGLVDRFGKRLARDWETFVAKESFAPPPPAPSEQRASAPPPVIAPPPTANSGVIIQPSTGLLNRYLTGVSTPLMSPLDTTPAALANMQRKSDASAARNAKRDAPQPVAPALPRGVLDGSKMTADEGISQVNEAREAARQSGALVGEGLSGSTETGSRFSAFASWSPQQMAARKAVAPTPQRIRPLTSLIMADVKPTAQTGVETRSATAPQVSVPNADASPDYDKNFREATMRAAQDGVRSAHMRDQTLVQQLGLSPYQQAQRRIGVRVTEGNGPRGYVKTPIGLGASQSVGISNNAMPRTFPNGGMPQRHTMEWNYERDGYPEARRYWASQDGGMPQRRTMELNYERDGYPEAGRYWASQDRNNLNG